MDEILAILMKEVEKAYKEEEIPVAAVIVKEGKIISKAHNTKQKNFRCIDHAEILAIVKAEKLQKDWRLDDCDIYVSLEPCRMCMEVIRQARIRNVYYILPTNFNNEDEKVIEKKEITCDDTIKNAYKAKLNEFFVSKR